MGLLAGLPLPRSPCTLCLLLLLLLLLLGSIHAEDEKKEEKPSKGTSKEMFYIYDWPSVVEKQASQGMLEHHGFGKLLSRDHGTYDTYQFNLYNVMFHRALSDGKRTRNPEEASTFLIPYDFHVDGMLHTFPNGSQSWSWENGSSDLAPEVVRLLQKSSFFQRKQGADHLLIIPWSYAYDQLVLKPKTIPLMQLCYNCTKITVEDFSFLTQKREYNSAQSLKGKYW